MEKYFSIGRMHGLSKSESRATPIITSRGCPGRCTFCSIHSVWGYNYRTRSPESVVKEIEVLQRDYHVNHLLFEDDNLTLNRQRAEVFFGLLAERCKGITWETPNGVAIWTLSRPVLKLMRDSGCHRLVLAIESGDQDTLTRIIQKPLSLEKVNSVVSDCRDLGIRTSGFFVLGMPGETLKSMKNSMKYATSLYLNSHFIMIAAPYPGTPLARICEEKGYLVKGFQKHLITTKVGLIQTPEFGPQDVRRLIDRTKIQLALKHPIKKYRDLVERQKLQPTETTFGVFRRVVQILFLKIKGTFYSKASVRSLSSDLMKKTSR
jgi:magnesium-protoporphyrin IX monomethyl ester (oxidative) cyclase